MKKSSSRPPRSIASSSSVSNVVNVTSNRPLESKMFFLLKYGEAVTHTDSLLTTVSMWANNLEGGMVF